MNSNFASDISASLALVVSSTLNEVSLYVPRILGALVVLLVGVGLAKMIKRLIVALLEALALSRLLQNTPVEHFIQNAEIKQKIEDLMGSLVYWLIMLIVIHSAVTILGLAPLSAVLDRVLGYIPHVFSAVLVLFFGLLLAGVVESLIKGAIKTIDGKASRLLGKISSYMVVTISVLVAVSELGIARDFIMILFVGFVSMLSLGVGLAVGLGGQDVVKKMLNGWYQRTKDEVRES